VSAARSPYRAPRWARNPHLQSVLASSRLRRMTGGAAARAVDAHSEAVVLDCGDGVRLSGARTPQTRLPEARGLVVLLHGWEGSIASSYLSRTGALLMDAGFDIFRLNFRDHGDSHALNSGLFHSCRIDEVVGAVAAAARRWNPKFLAVAGFSLGGNFALRVALRAPGADVTLDHAVAVCPVISPRNGLQAMEDAPWFYERYFRAKWRESLKRKQAVFPEHFDFADLRRDAKVREMTRELVERHTEFDHVDDYLDGYSIAGDRLSALGVPVSILTAEDDPVIPVSDFLQLSLPDSAHLEIAEHGGHCGFLLDTALNGYAERFILGRLQEAAQGVLQDGPVVSLPNS